MVENHRHVTTELLLNSDGPFGTQFNSRPIDMRAESSATFIECHAVGQTKDLKAAAVGQDRSVPTHERMKSAQRCNRLLTRPERQMIRVGQNHLRAGIS